MIDQSLVHEVLVEALAVGADFAEVFAETTARTTASLDDGRVENVGTSRDSGVGIRVMAGSATGFAHTADLSRPSLISAARSAAEAAVAGASDQTVARQPAPFVAVDAKPAGVAIDPATVSKDRKVALLRQAEEAARAHDEAIVQVASSYADIRRDILVANSEGRWATDTQFRTLFSVSCVAKGDVGLQTGRESAGLSVGFELFDRFDPAHMAVTAAARAVEKLGARPAPSGTLPVVIGPGSGGVLFHEACGHGLEADLVAKGASVFAGRVGEKVASELVTIVDQGGMDDEWGNYAVDDEGQPAKRNVLIENGVLKDFMWDGRQARKEGRASSGNGRRQSYRHLPMVRMTNTYLAPGSDDPADIIAGVDYGVYVSKLGGGQVNTASGDFVFGMVEAYMIRDGELAEPLREGQLIGNGPQVLQMIDAVGNDFEMGPPGTCGKDGQGVPVGDGVPTLRVTQMTVGGTAA